jgi:hypothetical protein
MVIVLLVEIVPPPVTVMNVLHLTVGASVLLTTVVSALSVPHTETVLLAEIVPPPVTVTSVPLTTVVSAPSAPLSTVVEIVPHMATAPSVPVPSVPALTGMHLAVSVPSVPHLVTVLLVETDLPTPIVQIVPHVTSVENVLVTTRTKHLVVPHQTSTLQRTRSHVSLLRKMSYLSASKHRQLLLLTSMA